MKTLFTGFTVAVLGVALTGCSEEPKEADLMKALQAEMERANGLVESMLGSEAGAAAATTIHALKKLGCKPSEEDGREEFRCKVEMDITYPPAKRQMRQASIRVVNEDKGWVIIKSF